MKRLFNLFVIILASFASASCSMESMNCDSDRGLNFNVMLERRPVSKAEDLSLEGPEGSIPLVLEQYVQTKSVEINHTVTFRDIYDEFEVEGRESGSSVFHDIAQYNSATGFWNLKNASYLWQPGKEVEIVAAASGRDNEPFFSGITYNGDPNSTASFNYSLPDSYNDQQDYLIGYFKGSPAQDGTISLKFSHPLTSLEFVTGPLPNGMTLQVNSITLQGIDAEAVCGITFGEDNVYNWDYYSGTVDYSQTIVNPHPMSVGEYILKDTAAFIVIPREFPANSEARILINITENGRTYDMYAPLAGQVWEPGKTIVYQLSYHGETKATLLDGPAFNDAISAFASQVVPNEPHNFAFSSQQFRKLTGIRHIVFEVNSTINTGTPVQAPGARPIYMNYNSSTKTVTVSTNDFAFYTSESAQGMFAGLVDLVDITGLQYLQTGNAKDMSYMFAHCKLLTSFSLSNFNTENVTNMTRMFYDCASVSTLDLSSFNTDNVTTAAWLFCCAENLSNIIWGDHFNLPKNYGWTYFFCMTKIRNMDHPLLGARNANVNVQFMFAGCHELTSVDLSSFRSTMNESVWCMFDSCFKLKTLNLGSYQTLASVTKKTHMLYFTGAQLPSGEKCTITCTQAAKDFMTTGNDPQNVTNYDPNRVIFNTVPQTTEP